MSLLIDRRPYHVILPILLAGDVATNLDPFSGHGGHVNSLVRNARSLKNIQRDEQSNQVVCNLQRLQDLVYSENSDVICVNVTYSAVQYLIINFCIPGFPSSGKIEKSEVVVVYLL